MHQLHGPCQCMSLPQSIYMHQTDVIICGYIINFPSKLAGQRPAASADERVSLKPVVGGVYNFLAASSIGPVDEEPTTQPPPPRMHPGLQPSAHMELKNRLRHRRPRTSQRRQSPTQLQPLAWRRATASTWIPFVLKDTNICYGGLNGTEKPLFLGSQTYTAGLWSQTGPAVFMVGSNVQAVSRW